jgi:hypothetical protein
MAYKKLQTKLYYPISYSAAQREEPHPITWLLLVLLGIISIYFSPLALCLLNIKQSDSEINLTAFSMLVFCLFNVVTSVTG